MKIYFHNLLKNEGRTLRNGCLLVAKHKIIDFFVESKIKVHLEIEIEDQEVNEGVGGRVSKRE